VGGPAAPARRASVAVCDSCAGYISYAVLCDAVARRRAVPCRNAKHTCLYTYGSHSYMVAQVRRALCALVALARGAPIMTLMTMTRYNHK
jgi:hypothetical protein